MVHTAVLDRINPANGKFSPAEAIGGPKGPKGPKGPAAALPVPPVLCPFLDLPLPFH